ncbi:unnamed protein product [Sphagnum tenellum]
METTQGNNAKKTSIRVNYGHGLGKMTQTRSEINYSQWLPNASEREQYGGQGQNYARQLATRFARLESSLRNPRQAERNQNSVEERTALHLPALLFLCPVVANCRFQDSFALEAVFPHL